MMDFHLPAARVTVAALGAAASGWRQVAAIVVYDVPDLRPVDIKGYCSIVG
jgi:hypothetical protein